MKILLVHNNYGKYSGEEAVVDKMSTMLKGLGHEVAQLRMSTEGLRDSAVFIRRRACVQCARR